MTTVVDTLNRSVLDRCCVGKCVGTPQRVYIVAVVCILTVAQSIVANTWSPIVETAESTLHWTDSTIGMLQIWFIVVAIACGLPLIYLMENKGLRLVILIASTSMLIGSMLRTIPINNHSAFTILNNIGTAVLAVSMPVFPTCCSVVAATWFPAESRVLATSAIVGSAILGSAVSFVLGPAIVSGAPQYYNLSGLSNGSNANLSSDLNWRVEAKDEILGYLFLQFLLVLIGWICVVLYFPPRPTEDPSVSAGFGRDEFFKGLKNLVVKPAFWFMCLSFAFVVGIMSVWVPVMGIGLRPLNIDEKMIGWIGMTGTLACVPYAVITSTLGQKYRKMKTVLIVSLSIATVCFLLFALICMSIIPNNLPGVFIVLVIGGATSLGCVPTYFELTCECCFPVYEGLCTIIMGFSSTILSITFFIPILSVPNTPFEMYWVSWSPFVAVIVGLIGISFLKEEYNRLNLDAAGGKQQSAQDPDGSDKAPLLANSDDGPSYNSNDSPPTTEKETAGQEMHEDREPTKDSYGSEDTAFKFDA